MNLLNHARITCLVGGIALACGELAERQAALGLQDGVEPVHTADFPEVATRDSNKTAVDLLLPEMHTAEPDITVVEEFVREDAAAPPFGTNTQGSTEDCTPKLDLVPQSGAMIGLSLFAPCNPDQRIVISHAGLAVTGRTTASGSHYSSITALERDAKVKVRIDSGEVVEANIAMPEVESLRRFAVQWLGDDAFQLQAFVGDADYFDEGHYSALRPGSVIDGRFVSSLGDPSTSQPLLAEVFTEPLADDDSDRSEVLIEAETTAATCGREIMGEVIERDATGPVVSELVLAMPDCDGIGDIVVLKNLVSEMKLAAAK